MNKIIIDAEIASWAISASLVKSQLDQMSGDVIVEINSPGGSVFEGISIFNALHSYNKGKVIVSITGLAASIASYIALVGDEIEVYDNATFMIHNAWTFAYGDANELRKTADILEGLSSIIAKKYIERTGKSADEVKNMMDQESYFYGEEIVAEGFGTKLISTDKNADKNAMLALSRESFKASCQKVKEKFDNDEFEQCVAKLVKDGNILNNASDNVPPVENKVLLDEIQQQQREREIEILKREVI